MHKATRRHSNSDLSRDLEKIKAAIAGAAWHAKDRASDTLAQSIADLQDRSNAMQENVTDYVTERPFKTIGLALLSGIVLGYFLPHK